MRRLLGIALAFAVIAPVVVSTQDVPAPASRVIVTLKNGVSLASFAGAYVADARLADQRRFGYESHALVGAVLTLERRYGFRATNFYSRAIKGFAASVTPAQAAALQADPLVADVEPDRPVALPSPSADPPQIIDWGIPKIGADQSSTHSGDGTGTVTGVTVYVIDTGVDPTHPDLNLVEHVSFAGSPNADCYGHGTGVAGIIAAKDNGIYTVGVAPGAPVVGVKVLNCNGIGFPSQIIQGVDWVTANAVKPAVANMSLGSAIPLRSLNRAVRASAASGVFYAVAAGNGNPFTGEAVSACLSSPAGAGLNLGGVPNGIATVAATDMNDEEASFSNYGPCVDLWAPGVDVTSLWLMSQGGLITASGTSFASPYVAGSAALLLSRIPTLTPPLVEYVLRATADVPGTLSKDGASIRRVSVRLF
jgi:subtilisin family serine protease